jgi:pSer/pThr/pTyr-binding forkhead associated (FHA) protein
LDNYKDLKEINLERNVTKFGREKINNFILKEKNISKEHFEILKKDNKFFLKDSGSTHGIFLNLENEFEIKQGVILQILKPNIEF